MKTLLKSPKNTFLIIFHWSNPGHESDWQNQENHQKIAKKFDFSKIDILFHSGRKYDIWPEIDPLDPGKPPESI